MAEEIFREHLTEISHLLRDRGVEGVTYYEYAKNAFLHFTSAFRDSVLAKVGIKPEPHQAGTSILFRLVVEVRLMVARLKFKAALVVHGQRSA